MSGLVHYPSDSESDASISDIEDVERIEPEFNPLTTVETKVIDYDTPKHTPTPIIQ